MFTAMYATDDPNVAGEISYYAGQDLRFDAFMAETLTHYRELRDDYTERGIEECVALCNDALERIPNLTKAKDVAAIEREINNKLDVVENYWKIETYYSDGPESVQAVIDEEVKKIEANTDLKAQADQSYLSVDAIKEAYFDELALAKEDAMAYGKLLSLTIMRVSLRINIWFRSTTAFFCGIFLYSAMQIPC